MPRTRPATVLLAALWLLAAAPGLADTPSPFTLGPVSAKQTGPWQVQVNLPAALVQPVALAPDVPVPVSYLQFIAPLPVPGWLDETNLLGSGYEVNLDGSDMLDTMTVKVEGGALRIDQEPVEPMGTSLWGPQQPYKADGSQRVYLLDPDSPFFTVLFFDAPVLGMQLQHHGYIPTVKKLPNPTLEIAVFEFCDGLQSPADLADEPSFTLDFGEGPEPDQHLVYSWEPWVCAKLGQPVQWLCSRVAFLPMPTKPGAMDTVMTVDTTSGSDLLFMLARVNYSLEPGTRLRTDAVVGEIWQGPGGRPHKLE